MNPDFYKKLLENLYDGIYYVNTDRIIKFWNAGAERLTGFLKSDVLESKCADNILRHIDGDGNALCVEGCPLAETMKDGQFREIEVFMHHKRGHRIPVVARATPIYGESGEIVGAVEVFSSNSKNVYAIEELERLQREVMVDPLTKIGNRRYAELNLGNLLREKSKHGVNFGLLMLDIVFFKRVNDKYGHNIGDLVIIMVAKTITNTLRALDVPCRWGGEEFIVLLPNVDLNVLSKVAERLRMLVENSFLIESNEKITVTVSIGGTICSVDDNKKSIVARADQQLYRCKQTGRNKVHIYQ